MPKIKKTPDNPHGLSAKQKMVVEDVKRKIVKGENMDVVESTQKIYDVKNKQNARNISSANMNRENFRNALLSELHEDGIIGPGGKVERRLKEGLDAIDYKYDEPDHTTRLNYIKEINKVADIYAPHRIEKKELSLKMDMTEEELDEKIKDLQEQLGK